MEEKYKEPKDMATALDCAIGLFEGKQGGYIIKGKEKSVIYYNYMTNKDWEYYFNNMNDCHKKQYDNGSGGELKEGQYPPKMASFGSSSRLVYELSKDISGFSFEEKLDTRVGGTANIDGFFHSGKEYIYVEAKRREIYGGSHKNQDISEVYLPVYKKIKEECQFFSYDLKPGDKNGSNKVTFKFHNTPVDYFDLKQLICHFLGITYDIAKHPLQDIKVKFLYLIYDPHKVERLIDKKYTSRICTRYNNVEKFITQNIDCFRKIFNAILDYHVDTYRVNKPKISFEMILVNPNTYKDNF